MNFTYEIAISSILPAVCMMLFIREVWHTHITLETSISYNKQHHSTFLPLFQTELFPNICLYMIFMSFTKNDMENEYKATILYVSKVIIIHPALRQKLNIFRNKMIESTIEIIFLEIQYGLERHTSIVYDFKAKCSFIAFHSFLKSAFVTIVSQNVNQSNELKYNFDPHKSYGHEGSYMGAYQTVKNMVSTTI